MSRIRRLRLRHKARTNLSSADADKHRLIGFLTDGYPEIRPPTRDLSVVELRMYFGWRQKMFEGFDIQLTSYLQKQYLNGRS
jgi:hypothetical protein